MGVFTMRNDDSDMKIMGDDYDLPEPKDDTQETAQLLQREKENGNLNRARQLGALMAEEVSAVEGDFPAVEPALLTQRRILLAFVVEVGFDGNGPKRVLRNVAEGCRSFLRRPSGVRGILVLLPLCAGRPAGGGEGRRDVRVLVR